MRQLSPQPFGATTGRADRSRRPVAATIASCKRPVAHRAPAMRPKKRLAQTVQGGHFPVTHFYPRDAMLAQGL